jgi:hypothetical protein
MRWRWAAYLVLVEDVNLFGAGAGRYLASFAWRSNRRFQLTTLIRASSTARQEQARCLTISSSPAEDTGYSG